MTAPRRLCAAVLVFGLGLGLSGVDANAAVYRCGNSYADVPCPRSTVIDADDARSDADRTAAHDVARREAALAARMVADRESEERRLRPAPPARVSKPPARAASAATAPRRTSRERLRVDVDGNFIAIVPRKR